METRHQHPLIYLFTRHKVAANLLMAIMILSGVWALLQINIQFLPTFHLQIIQVNVPWPGASAEDIERSITTPIELELRNIDDIKKLTSNSRLGFSNILLV